LSDEKEVERGRLAEDILANPVYQDSFAMIEQEITRKWRESRDKDEREHLHLALRMLDKSRQVLEATMRTGKVALSELQRKRTLGERLTGRLRNAA
jgi:hypothetical protein